MSRVKGKKQHQQQQKQHWPKLLIQQSTSKNTLISR